MVKLDGAGNRRRLQAGPTMATVAEQCSISVKSSRGSQHRATGAWRMRDMVSVTAWRYVVPCSREGVTCKA